jgi:hypothetical protein
MSKPAVGQQDTNQVDIQFSDDAGGWTGGDGSHAVRMAIEVPGHFREGNRMTLSPGVYQFEIERTDTDESIVFELDSKLSSTTEVASIYNEFFDSTGSINDSPTVGIRTTNEYADHRPVSVISGDRTIFSTGDVFGSYIFRLRKDGTVLGSTEERVHGIGYPDGYREVHEDGRVKVQFPAIDEVKESWEIMCSITNIYKGNDQGTSPNSSDIFDGGLHIDDGQLVASFDLDNVEPVPEEGSQFCWITFRNVEDNWLFLRCRGYHAEDGEDRSDVIGLEREGPAVFRRISTATNSPAAIGIAGAGGVGAAYLGYKTVLSGSEEDAQQNTDDIETTTSKVRQISSDEVTSETPQIQQFTDLNLSETIKHTPTYQINVATAFNKQYWVMTPPENDQNTIDISEFDTFIETAERWNGMDSHPYVTSVHGSGEEPLPWIACEPCDDPPLLDRIDDLSNTEQIEAVQQICDALHHVHRYGTTYENLTTKSILYTDNANVKLRGILDQFEELDSWYHAPEEFDGETTEQSTVYRIGLIAYELFTGTLPYKTYPDGVQRGATQTTKVILPSEHVDDISTELESVLMKALAQSPADRHETVLHLRDELSRVNNMLDDD